MKFYKISILIVACLFLFIVTFKTQKESQNCAFGYSRVANGPCVRICPDDQTYVGGDGGHCVLCPSGTRWIDKLKQCIACPSKMSLYHNNIREYEMNCGLSRYSCGENSYNKNGTCVDCANGMFVNKDRDNCIFDKTSDKIHLFYSDPSYNRLLGQYDGHKRYGSCPDGSKYIKGDCYSCPEKTKWNNQIKTCIPDTIECPTGTRWKNGVCMSCPSNTKWNGKTDTCNFI